MDNIRVGPLRYKVVELPIVKSEDGRDLYGEIDYVERKIRISTAQPEAARLPTYWHEVIHGILAQAAMHKQNNNEQLVTILANGIVQVLQDNPEMSEV